MEIREANLSDASAIAEIYNHYVVSSTITFEEQPVTPEEMATRVEAVFAQGLPWLVAVESASVIGFACAMPWKVRSAYRFSAEVTVYVATGHSGRGIGSALYRGLLPALAASGRHTVLAGIALPNAASIGFHERFGFKKVAHLSQVGFKMQRWVDVGYWQLLLDASASSERADASDLRG